MGAGVGFLGDLGRGALSIWDMGGKTVALVGFLVFVALFLANFWLSYRLLRLYHIGEARGARLSVLIQLLEIVLTNPLSVVRSKTMFKRTRLRIEYETLNPRPKPVVSEAGLAPGERYVEKLANWRKGLRELFGASSKETLEVKTPQKLHEHFENVDRYFDALERLKCGKREMQFETKIKIKTGFAAPLHLVAGVLRKFDEDWDTVLEVYEIDRFDFSQLVGPQTQRALAELREIQLFIFDCWLLWGPSIPICDQHCARFGGTWSSLQYGFGDENNSVEIVGTRAFLSEQWTALAPRSGVRAVSAGVLGHIANSRFLDPQEAGERMGHAVAQSWNADGDGKLLVLVSEEEVKRTADAEAHEVRDIRVSGTGAIHIGNAADAYYSAYLWAIFVVLREEPGAATLNERVWVPVHNDPAKPRSSRKPWLDFFSFFEHGNIADPETYDFLKRQLAEKAISGLAKIVAVYGEGDYPLRFAFACSIDEAGCGHDKLYEPNALGLGESGFERDSLPDLMWHEIRDRRPELADIVLFDYYDKSVHPHSACNLPRDIEHYFDHIGEDAS